MIDQWKNKDNCMTENTGTDISLKRFYKYGYKKLELFVMLELI